MQKVLIVRFSSIGDIVLTSPVVRCLHEQTGVEVHFLTKAGFAGIMVPNPHVHKVWTIKKHVTEIIAELRQEGFTHVVDLHRNLRTLTLRLLLSRPSWLLAGQVWQPKYYRFNKLNWPKYLLTRWKIDRMPDVHVVDRYLETVRPFGVTNDGKGLDYFTDGGTSKVAMQKLRDLGESLPGERYLAFVIGAAHNTKRLTEQQMTDFCRSYTGRILLLGGPGEAEQGERIATAGGDHVINTCGKFKLAESAKLVESAAAVLTHDTGLMHIAAAYGKAIVSVWGNTVPTFGMYPYLPGQEDLEKQRRVETLGLNCRPCSKIGHQVCPKGHFRCIKEIEVGDILEKVSAVVKKTQGH